MIRTDILEQKEQILQWIEENQSKAFICRQLHCKPETLNSYLKKMNIEYAGNKGLKGMKTCNDYIPVKEYIKKDNVKTLLLKEKLLREGYKENQCEICGIDSWQGSPIILELHHKDGNHYNNELDNLMLICPNCHSQQHITKNSMTTQTHSKDTKDKSNNSQENKNNNSNHNHNKKEYRCCDCGKIISKGATRCKSCSSKYRAAWTGPSREELKKLIRTMPFVQIGEKYGVSDNAIRKWCDRYNLPRTKREINSYSDEEWKKL